MIALNCRFLTQEVTGVQRFAEEVVSALTAIRTDLILVAPPGPLRRHSIGGERVNQIGRHGRHRWEQFDLPDHLRHSLGSPLLVSLTNTGPVGYRHQLVAHHDVSYVRFPETYSWRFRTAYRLLAKFLLRRALGVVTVSEFSRDEIHDVYGVPLDRIHVIQNAASADFSRPPGFSGATAGASAPTPYFLAVSSLLPHKNIPRLIAAYEQFQRETGSPTRLVLVGSRPETLAGADSITVSADTRVEFLGRVTDSELIDLYRDARALVFPSKYEGFGIPPLEAQAAGVPVASSTAASLPEVLGTSARFFDPDNTGSIAEALFDIDTSETMRSELARRGTENVARYCWQTAAAKLSQLIDDVQRLDLPH